MTTLNDLALAIDLEERRRVAMLASDIRRLQDLLDDSLIYLHSTGQRDSRVSFLGKLKEGQLRYDFLNFILESARSTDKFLLAQGRMEACIRVDGVERQVRSCYEAVWMRTSEAWVCIAIQSYLPPVDATLKALEPTS